MAASSEKYSLKVECSNCNFKGDVLIPKGILFKDSTVPCPTCGCETLERPKTVLDSLDGFDKFKRRTPIEPSRPFWMDGNSGHPDRILCVTTKELD